MPKAKCAHKTCSLPARENSIYCSDQCRKRAARLSYAKRQVKPNKTTSAKVEQGMTGEEFEQTANRLLATRVPLPDIPAKVRATRVEDMGFNTPQHAVACFSDYHFGSKVDPVVTGGIGGLTVYYASRR